MKLVMIIGALALTGCAAQRQPYTVNTGVVNPTAVIEQALMEQGEDERPDYVRSTSEYVEYGMGAEGSYNGFTNKSRSRQKVTRLYYKSVKEEAIFTKRNYVIVQFKDGRGEVLARVEVGDLAQGRKLADAVETLKARD